ncbi:hypothetical protein XELAEV_18036012mg [Xenopus laevis]|uniref:Ig-like domain-containing protein n=1 Tax=Xenopus laevis TaxID=8355 RepID=A0A974CH31_XENLA|nr:hypothetical protein XELAEV_18036012mg [Xenopus laevis]
MAREKATAAQALCMRGYLLTANADGGDVGNCTAAGTDEQGTADLQKVHAGSAAVLQKAQNVAAKRSSSREPGRRNQVPLNGWSPYRRICTRQEAEFLVWINLIHGITIQLNPKYPVANQPVTFSVSGFRGTVLSFSWYRGLPVDNSCLILTYNSSSNPKETRGQRYSSQFSVLPDGSLKISSLSSSYRDYYTVQVQAESLTQKSIYPQYYVPLTQPVISIANPRPGEGDNVTLLCKLESKKAKVSWSRINGSIPSEATFDANNRNMNIPRFTQSHIGQYQCTAVNKVSKNISDPYTLSLYNNEPRSGNSAAFTAAIICGCILGTVLIICAVLLLYKKYILPLTGEA